MRMKKSVRCCKYASGKNTPAFKYEIFLQLQKYNDLKILCAKKMQKAGIDPILLIQDTNPLPSAICEIGQNFKV